MGRWVTSKGRRIYIPDEGEENPFAKEKSLDKSKSKNPHTRVQDIADRMKNAKTEAERESIRDEMDKVWKDIDHNKKLSDVDKNHLTSRLRDIYDSSKTKTINDRLKEDAEKFRKDPNVAAREGWGNGYYQEVKEYMNQQKDTVKETISKNENLKEKQIMKNKKQVDKLNDKSSKSSLEKANSQAKINAENSKVLNKLYEKRKKFSKAGDGRFIVDFEQFGGTMQAFKALAKAEGFEVLDSDADSVTLRRKRNK